ncbi:MAG: hypothetical protein ABT16_00495 [Rhodanobacter sp. SCN 65-17]|nr:MAG: hypothetical protein ABT16_00495 [Rhodanobacter sp. SCN 65-17]
MTLASALGPTYSAIVSGPVGVTVGTEPPPPAIDRLVSAPLVGVSIPQDPPAPITADTQAVAMPVHLLVGAEARDMDTSGWLQGASGTLTVHGVDLQGVTTVTVTPATGILFGDVTVNADASALSVPISVAQDAPLGSRQLHLQTASGEVTWVSSDAAALGIGHIPTMQSLTPIVLTAGQTATLTVRGKDLSSVNGATLLPADGATFVGSPMWSQDSLGELLTVTVRLDPAAPTGKRVLQLLVPGGATSAEPSEVNSITVVAGP